MIHIQLPSQFSGMTAGRTHLEVRASNLGEVFHEMDAIAPMVRSQIFDATGNLRQFVGLFVDDLQINDIGDGMQALGAGSRVLVVMAVAGG